MHPERYTNQDNKYCQDIGGGLERSHETFAEEIPPNIRLRLEHTQALLRGETIENEKQTSAVADTVATLVYFLSRWDDTILQTEQDPEFGMKTNEIPTRQELFEVPGWCMGTDIDDGPVQQEIQDIYSKMQASIREHWFALSRLITNHFTGDKTELRHDISVWISKLCKKESERLRLRETKEPPKPLAPFPEDIRNHLLQNTFTVELTEGCSVRCTFCAFNAAKGVKGHMPFDEALWLIRRMNKSADFYYATDPLDYRTQEADGHERTYSDIMDASMIIRYRDDPSSFDEPYTSTAVPIKSLDVFRRVSDRISRISISVMNERQLIKNNFLKKTDGGTYILTDPNLVWRFWSDTQLYPSHIVDVYRFTKERYGYGSTPMYRSGRERMRPHEEGHASGDIVEDSIACSDGVLLSPSMVRNSVRMMTTAEYPNGVAEAVLQPENLENGIDQVLRIASSIESGSHVPIEHLMTFVVIQFGYSGNRRTNTLQGIRTRTEWTPKKNLELQGRLKFIAFKKEKGGINSVSYICHFDRISGHIQKIDLNVP